MPDDQASKTASAKEDEKPRDGARLTSSIFIVTAGTNHEQYAVHEDILKQSKVLGRMCDGNFKEAHERRITLPDDDPIDIGILVEYLYMKTFWTSGNPDGDASKQDSAVRLAHLYLLADKYDLESMKDVITKKIYHHTDINVPEDWLAVAEIIYTATPDNDRQYPETLRSLVVRFMAMKCEQEDKNGWTGALLDWTAKGGRLAVDISLGHRMFWVERVRYRNAALTRANDSISEQLHLHWDNHSVCSDCFKEPWALWVENLDNDNLEDEVTFDKNIMYPE
ncbi:MAG: hypothetical protein Q9208_005170 [Pyrenodesmia sp. 3 TL-2023]